MKAIKTLNAVLAASLLTGATLAQAASYEITGTLDSFSTDPAIITASFTPTAPTFAGTWNVDTSSVSGNANFAAYSVDWSVLGNLAGSTSYTADNYQLASTSSSYDALTRTLTITSGTVDNTLSTNTCVGASFICGNALPSYSLSLVLTFTDATLQSFTGSLVATNDDGAGSQYSYAWSFDGEASVVPVPAAAWLFGSAVIGLGGLARSRKSKA
jgi:hypothetical protein